MTDAPRCQRTATYFRLCGRLATHVYWMRDSKRRKMYVCDSCMARAKADPKAREMLVFSPIEITDIYP